MCLASSLVDATSRTELGRTRATQRMSKLRLAAVLVRHLLMSRLGLLTEQLTTTTVEQNEYDVLFQLCACSVGQLSTAQKIKHGYMQHSNITCT